MPPVAGILPLRLGIKYQALGEHAEARTKKAPTGGYYSGLAVAREG
jgi:hypothetical protein